MKSKLWQPIEGEHDEGCVCVTCMCTIEPEDRPEWFRRCQSNAPWCKGMGANERLEVA